MGELSKVVIVWVQGGHASFVQAMLTPSKTLGLFG